MQPRLHFAMMTREPTPGEWVLLTYRMPREPSTPRSALWRRLRRLGVAQLADGLVGLPADARTREQLEWIADEVREADGTAGVWLARPTGRRQEQELAEGMAAARAAEYRELSASARAARKLPDPERMRAIRQLRAELHRIQRRDFFPPPARDAAVAAVEQLAAAPPGRMRRAAEPSQAGRR
jgi:hypothetical protein